MILATTAILRAIADGAIICDPAPARVEGAHIDVTLGPHFWLFTPPIDAACLDLESADPLDWYRYHRAYPFISLALQPRIIVPARGFILAHTAEAIGTAPGSGLVPMLHTRSTLARWRMSVCTANAGQGDEGYCGIWTLEIENPHPVAVALPVGARIGAVAFHRVEGEAVNYEVGTRYNKVAHEWTPKDMLPRRSNW